MRKTLITSALPYANGHIHLGHAAGAYLPADIYARYKRLNGENVLYVCGSDEHGVAITISAEKEKVSPQDIIDKYHLSNKDAFEKFGMSFDIYSRTSKPHHHDTAREFFADALKKGFLVEKEEEQFYDEKAEMFLPDRYVEGECPNCGYEHARGDQCDKCGAYYNQTELNNPKSTITGNTPVLKKTTHWYFQFDKMQKFLEEYIESNSKEWKDNVIQQSKSWLNLGLTERAITRDLKWGVEIQGIEGIDDKKAEGKRLYVWFDAVLGYMSITKEYFAETDNPEEWREWWQSPETDYYAFIGKDNIVFHTLIFPAMLNTRKDNENPYILPKNVPANEFLNLEGQKFSKSRNWSIDLGQFIESHPEHNYIDTLRYTLAANAPETKDADFTWKDYQARNNNELAAIYGNFINRTLQFLSKRFDSKVPELSDKYNNLEKIWRDAANAVIEGNDITSQLDSLEENDRDLLKSVFKELNALKSKYEKFKFREVINHTMNIARASNKYFNDEEPWKTVKNDFEKCSKTMYVCCQLVNTLSIVFAPIIPFSSDKVMKLLGKAPYTGAPLKENNVNFWYKAYTPELKSGFKIEPPEILFTRIEDDWVEAEFEKLGDKKPKIKKPEYEEITIDDFVKVKFVTAKVLEAEKIKKSKKLIKLQVDLGFEKRQILAGVAEHYQPEELVGKNIVVVANLKPAKLMGQESQGMMLAASTSDGKLCIISPETDVHPGSEVR
jgi:methionyl-tRNA synthetase